MADTKPCTTVFSNGTEYEWFLETNCERECKRLRNGQCAVLQRIEKARFDESVFPYDELLDFAGGYAGKVCKRYTSEPQTRKHTTKPLTGQIAMEVTGDG